MNLCFISGFSQPASILSRLGQSIKLEANKTYLSPSELAGHGNYSETLYGELKNKKNLVLVGWSLGGFLAIEYAAKYEVDALVILSGTSCYLKTKENSHGIELARMEALIKGVTQTKEQSLKRFISSVCSPLDSDSEDFENCYQAALKIDSNVLVHNLEYFKKDFSSLCKDIKCPTLLIHDQGDRVVPVEQGMMLTTLIKNSKIYLTSGYGHLVIQRAAEILANEIEKFLRREHE